METQTVKESESGELIFNKNDNSLGRPTMQLNDHITLNNEVKGEEQVILSEDFSAKTETNLHSVSTDSIVILEPQSEPVLLNTEIVSTPYENVEEEANKNNVSLETVEKNSGENIDEPETVSIVDQVNTDLSTNENDIIPLEKQSDETNCNIENSLKHQNKGESTSKLEDTSNEKNSARVSDSSCILEISDVTLDVNDPAILKNTVEEEKCQADVKGSSLNDILGESHPNQDECEILLKPGEKQMEVQDSTENNIKSGVSREKIKNKSSEESILEREVTVNQEEADNIEQEQVTLKELEKQATDTTIEEELQKIGHEPQDKDSTLLENSDKAESVSVSKNDVLEMLTDSDGGIVIQEYDISEEVDVTQIQEGNYTILESQNSDNAAENEGGTLILIDDGNTTCKDEDLNPDATVVKDKEPTTKTRMSTRRDSDIKPKRGRKSTCEVPMHVLGHNIDKPVEPVSNGRAAPKPRLGVKVPYRNLISQIVSKAEIEKEIMDRARIKQEQANSRGDNQFARKLTQRLAKKIAPNATEIDLGTVKTSPSKLKTDESTKIPNDSDLLAILEGEEEENQCVAEDTKDAENVLEEENKHAKNLEREIALQQLYELPHQEPKQRVYRNRQAKADKSPVHISETAKVAEKMQQVRDTMSDSQKTISDKENTTRVSKVLASSNKTQATLKQPIEIEPQVKVNMVLKTYSRKRKQIEFQEPLLDSAYSKRTVLEENEIKPEKSQPSTPSDVYVTKSSRVIKRKVIWDPDEAPSRSPKVAPKPVTEIKVIKLSDKNSSSEKVVDKKQLVKVDKLSPKKDKIPSPIEKKVIVAKICTKMPVKLKRKCSEVDKLLMDEGAVKMLYELKNNDESSTKKKKDVYSVEKAHKEIIKKANEIKSDLQQTSSNESPKSLRKKDGLTTSPGKPVPIGSERKMSKDSTRSSLHTPPGSPSYSFAQSSMLVRRRSSSSISSRDEDEANDSVKTRRKSNNGENTKAKKIKKNYEEAKVHQEVTTTKLPDEEVTPVVKAVQKQLEDEYKTFQLKKIGKHTTINLIYQNNKCYLSLEAMKEIIEVLETCSKDDDCLVVSVTSCNKYFCLGLDYKSLVHENEQERKKKAQELANCVREYLLCLLRFPKVLVAGVNGDCSGIGVTMLPLFDMVIATDTSFYSTPNASLGCTAEGACLLSPPSLTNHGLDAELLYTSLKLSAEDALRRGLISKLCWPEKYEETFQNIASSVSNGSKTSLEATKKHLRSNSMAELEAAITSQSPQLVEQWIGPECQKSFSQI